MRKALVLGASGGMGYSIVKELQMRNIEVVAFARNGEKLRRLFNGDEYVTITTGDIFNPKDLEIAATGVDVIFQSANIPYSQWESNLEIFINNVVDCAKKHSAKLAIVDNIYAYGRSTGSKVKETLEKRPNTKKGTIRLQLEKLVKESGVSALIAHFPDFYGPNAENAILHYTLQGISKNKPTSFVGDKKIAREYIYTPDGAKAIVNLALCEKAYGENWNIPGYDVITGEELITIIRNLTGYDKRVSTISKNMIRFIGLFNKDMREVVEMFYLNEEPVVLDGLKYESEFGELPRTSYAEGLKETLEFMKRIG